MSKSDVIEVEGTVLEMLPNAKSALYSTLITGLLNN